ncbi:rhomboid family intramembrane serine protease [Acanthopleuribacter pedis]|uniref:Rhomboid family intramembrane serine protease n=1 Tax=Acanthopleuribacter pedis TaxID=442870 RepID=A0A8J7Q3S8_9BACT|nr:rhomboid family intramembrane serine protease [Acanthopleuribacter pedis]MBO1317131.1 rhomboid family intramembrane serine protease [Acanthopleuribacter pedis]
MIRFTDSYRVPGKVRATWVLLMLNVLAFYVTHFAMGPDPYPVFFAGAVIPAELFAPETLAAATPLDPATRAPAVLALFWGMFLHADLFHLLTNMLFFTLIAPNLEASMGWKRFLLYYFSCGAVGTLCQVLYDTSSVAPIIGASGAISGLLGGYLILFGHHDFRFTIGKFRGNNYRDHIIPYKGLLAMWLLGQFLGFITQLGSTATQQIAFMTHIGGFVAGLLLAHGRGGGGLRRGKFRVFKGGKAA